MATSWATVFERTLEGEGSARDFLYAITHWFGEDLAQEPEDSHEAIGRRISWVFPNGLSFTIGAGFAPTLCWLSEFVDEDADLPDIAATFGPWVFARYANGWVNLGNLEGDLSGILGLVDSLSATFGEPVLALPWHHIWTEVIVENAEDYYESFDSEYGDDPQSNPYRTMSRLAHAVLDGTLASVSPWPLKLCDPDDFMSDHSDWSRFHRVVQRLSSQNLMFVRLDQYSASTTDPTPEGMSQFITWGRDGAVACLGNGFIGAELEVALFGDSRDLVRAIAREEGFINSSTLEGDEWTWTPGPR